MDADPIAREWEVVSGLVEGSRVRPPGQLLCVVAVAISAICSTCDLAPGLRAS